MIWGSKKFDILYEKFKIQNDTLIRQGNEIFRLSNEFKKLKTEYIQIFKESKTHTMAKMRQEILGMAKLHKAEVISELESLLSMLKKNEVTEIKIEEEKDDLNLKLDLILNKIISKKELGEL